MDLTLDKLKEVADLVGPLKHREPIFYCAPYVVDIHYGEAIDEIIKGKVPSFNSRYHEGFLIPSKYRKVIGDTFGFNSIVN